MKPIYYVSRSELAVCTTFSLWHVMLLSKEVTIDGYIFHA